MVYRFLVPYCLSAMRQELTFPGVALYLTIRYHGGRRHLPIVTLKRAA